MKRYDGDYAQGFAFARRDTDLVFGRKSSIDDDLIAIMLEKEAKGGSLTLEGRIVSGKYGVANAADNSAIEIAKSGKIQAEVGIAAEGQHQSITNAGKVVGEDTGIRVFGTDMQLVNSGTITGGVVGVTLAATLTGPVESLGQVETAIQDAIAAGSGDLSNKLVNLGTITSANYAFVGGDFTEHVINRGTMKGDILLNAGDDIFNGRGGQTPGHVYGGEGNDKYIIDKAAIDILEISDAGMDKVLSSVSYALRDNFESLTLAGRANLIGQGNSLDNAITGNAGNNRLYGSYGVDTLSGGKGNDRLNGGGDVDVFVFKTGFGRDTIEDYEDGVDHLDIGHWKGLDDYDDLMAHARDKQGDLIISFKGDQLAIENYSKAQFERGDFEG